MCVGAFKAAGQGERNGKFVPVLN